MKEVVIADAMRTPQAKRGGGQGGVSTFEQKESRTGSQEKIDYFDNAMGYNNPINVMMSRVGFFVKKKGYYA